MTRILPVLASLLLAAPALHAQTLTPTSFPTLPSPIGVSLGDFNRDGYCDVATAHQSNTAPSKMSIMLGDSFGGLLAPVAYTCFGTGAVGITSADLNGDACLDVITVELVNNTSPFGRISVFLGDGLGGFLTAVPFQVGAGARGVAVADFDLDGKIDVATANSSALANSVSVLLGDGLGNFTALGDTISGIQPWAIATGDIDNDGYPDIATADNGSSTLSILFNVGGHFPGPPSSYFTSAGPRGVAIGDLDGDGHPDVATCNGGGNDVTVFRGNGTAQLTVVGNFAVGTNPSSVTLGDVDGDGVADLCATDQTGPVSNKESVLLGNASLAYPTPNNFQVGNFPSSSKIADLNADGRADIVVSNYAGSGLTVLLNTAAPPASFTNYGNGTAGCRGWLGFTIESEPQPGNANFRFNATNAPRNSLGLVLVTDLPDVVGSDPAGLGATLHLDLFNSVFVLPLDARSDASGSASSLAPIPADPNLIGSSFSAQSLFVEAAGDHCSGSPFGIVTSRALTLVVTP